MIMRLALMAAVAIPTVSLAQGSSTQPGASDPNRQICRRQTEPGSRTAARRICMTRAQWEALARGARDEMSEDIRRRNGMTNCNGGAC